MIGLGAQSLIYAVAYLLFMPDVPFPYFPSAVCALHGPVEASLYDISVQEETFEIFQFSL